MNSQETILNDNQISYETLKQMQEHAKEYSFVSDKKEFLKNVSPYEQKLILLDSTNPYEVLSYLDELDMKNSRLILNELNFEEISKILELFSSENKRQFYEHFSDLAFVNQIIKHDQNASNYIKDLNFDRKVEIIDSSSSKTVESVEKVYDSMSFEQKTFVSTQITESDAISALSKTESYNKRNEEQQEENKLNEENKEQQEENKLNEENKEQQEETKLNEENKEQQEENKLNEENKEKTEEGNKENLTEVSKENEVFVETLGDAGPSVKSVEQDSNVDNIELFHQTYSKAESEFVQTIQTIIKNKAEEIFKSNESIEKNELKDIEKVAQKTL